MACQTATKTSPRRANAARDFFGGPYMCLYAREILRRIGCSRLVRENRLSGLDSFASNQTQIAG
jgi:hypothetical protein